MNILELAFKRHKNWIEIVESFGCNRDTAEDLVQEMYIKLDRISSSGTDLTYKDDINYFYVFKMLSTMFLDLKRKEGRSVILNLDEIPDLSIDQDLNNYEEKYQDVINAMDELYWYDKKVYEIVDDGLSISELSRKTKISYYSLYNTFNKVKKFLKSQL
jgi:DNA-directed RNA polymerase specialized sigma24 family protein